MANRWPADHFWAKIEKTDTCWLWRGIINGGYGQYSGEHAHRVSYRKLVGPIPEGLEVDHLCRVPLCVNPAHLEPVTRAENALRRSIATTHCKHGHEFTPENTYDITHLPNRGGRKSCRACNSAAVRRYKARRAAS